MKGAIDGRDEHDPDLLWDEVDNLASFESIDLTPNPTACEFEASLEGASRRRGWGGNGAQIDTMDLSRRLRPLTKQVDCDANDNHEGSDTFRISDSVIRVAKQRIVQAERERARCSIPRQMLPIVEALLPPNNRSLAQFEGGMSRLWNSCLSPCVSVNDEPPTFFYKIPAPRQE